MDENISTDFKQFITTTISQQFASVASKEDITRIEKKIDQVQSAVQHSAV